MASYSSPDAGKVIFRCGLSAVAFGVSESVLHTIIEDCLEDAEAEVEGDVGAANWASEDLTAGQVLLFQRLVSYRAGAQALIHLKIRRLQGTHEPLLQEDSAAFDEAIADLLTWATDLTTKVNEVLAGTTTTSTDLETGELSLPFSERSPQSLYLEDLEALAV